MVHIAAKILRPPNACKTLFFPTNDPPRIHPSLLLLLPLPFLISSPSSLPRCRWQWRPIYRPRASVADAAAVASVAYRGGLKKVGWVGVSAFAYHFCLNLPEKLSQPDTYFLAQPCKREDLCDISKDNLAPSLEELPLSWRQTLETVWTKEEDVFLSSRLKKVKGQFTPINDQHGRKKRRRSSIPLWRRTAR